MKNTLDLVDVITNRRSKTYLNEALAFAYQEMTGRTDDEIEMRQMQQRRYRLESLLQTDGAPSESEF